MPLLWHPNNLLRYRGGGASTFLNDNGGSEKSPFSFCLNRNRVFLNLWFGKPTVCMRVAFHENDGNDESDEDNSDSYKQGFERWTSENHGTHENDETHENPGCKPRVPQTTGLEIPEERRLSGRLLSQWARRDRLMSRGKNCRETIFVSQLSRNYPYRGVNFERG